MRVNEGKTDRLLRTGAAVVLAAAAVAVGATEVVGVVLLVIAGVLALTAVTGFCPLYALLGVSTARSTHQRPTVGASSRSAD